MQIEFPTANTGNAFGILVNLLRTVELKLSVLAIANVAAGIQDRAPSDLYLFDIDQDGVLVAAFIKNDLLNIGNFPGFCRVVVLKL